MFDPPEFRQVVGMLAVGDDSLVVADGRGHGAEAGQAIGKDMAAWARWRLAQSEIASELKPRTAVILA